LNNVNKLSIVNLITACLLVLGLIGCGQKEDIKQVSLEKKEKLKVKKTQPEKEHIRFLIGGMITPEEGYFYYRQFVDYIEKKLDKQVELIAKLTYAEVNALLKSGDVDVAFVCAKPYVDGHDEFGLELLAAPQVYGETVYYSYIIVHTNSPIQNFEELRDKSFAFTDPMSNTGKLVPTYMLAKIGETPDSFFDKYIYTYAHDQSIKRVAQGLVDGAAVDSLVWEYANRNNPEFTSKTKIIKKSPPYGIPPVAVRPGLDSKLKKEITEVLLNAHEDEKGRQILKGMMIDKFVIIDDTAYDTIREMKNWLSGQKIED